MPFHDNPVFFDPPIPLPGLDDAARREGQAFDSTREVRDDVASIKMFLSGMQKEEFVDRDGRTFEVIAQQLSGDDLARGICPFLVTTRKSDDGDEDYTATESPGYILFKSLASGSSYEAHMPTYDGQKLDADTPPEIPIKPGQKIYHKHEYDGDDTLTSVKVEVHTDKPSSGEYVEIGSLEEGEDGEIVWKQSNAGTYNDHDHTSSEDTTDLDVVTNLVVTQDSGTNECVFTVTKKTLSLPNSITVTDVTPDTEYRCPLPPRHHQPYLPPPETRHVIERVPPDHLRILFRRLHRPHPGRDQKRELQPPGMY